MCLCPGSPLIYHLALGRSMGSQYHPSMWDKNVHLSRTERRLLTHLVRDAGRIVSHKELLEAMSAGSPSKSIHSLRQDIFCLRKKIEVDSALPRVIISHYGQGYSFASKEEARWFPE